MQKVPQYAFYFVKKKKQPLIKNGHCLNLFLYFN